MMENIENITGVKIAYYFICPTKLWLSHHNIHLENEHENVKIGKQIHKDRYPRVKKEVNIRNKMKLDFIEKDNELYIHEVKKSDKMEKSHLFQMYFYMNYLQEHGVEAKGELHYPLLNKKKQVEFGRKEKKQLYEVIKNIKKIVSDDMPKPKRKKICKKCAYEEFCFSDNV
ncbi:MAG: CRISPR-associated protein Cas4 [Candidatus Thermoplasmatota archaeon]